MMKTEVIMMTILPTTLTRENSSFADDGDRGVLILWDIISVEKNVTQSFIVNISM